MAHAHAHAHTQQTRGYPASRGIAPRILVATPAKSFTGQCYTGNLQVLQAGGRSGLEHNGGDRAEEKKKSAGGGAGRILTLFPAHPADSLGLL